MRQQRTCNAVEAVKCIRQTAVNQGQLILPLHNSHSRYWTLIRIISETNQAGSLVGWCCSLSYADVSHVPSQSGGIDYHGDTCSDTHTMHWEIYYVHPQSGCILFLDTLRQASGGCPALCSGRNSADKHT